MKIYIPKKFDLGGRTITVEFPLYVEPNADYNTDGMAVYENQKIKISNRLVGDYRDYVFFHELVHHILDHMGETEIRQNEKFVSQFSTFLHQAMKTARDK